jgi:hypothetical protein
MCEYIWNLTQKLRESNLMQEYLDGNISLDDIETILEDRDSSNMIQDILNLKQQVVQLCSLGEVSPAKLQYKPNDFKTLTDLGMILASSMWWERFQTITQTMGVTCVLSIRTAESLFKRDPHAEEIKTILRQLVEENNV